MQFPGVSPKAGYQEDMESQKKIKLHKIIYIDMV